MVYDPGLIAWLRGLRERRPRNQIDIRDAIDKRFSAMAVAERLVRLHELPTYTEESDRSFALLVELTTLISQALDENP
jgi:hypothetical protein